MSTHQTSTLVQLQIPSPKQYKPSRFNAHTIDDDGAMLLYNSFTGHNCCIPAGGVQHVQRYLSATGFSEALDDVGNYLLQKGYIVEDSVDEDARWDVRYGLYQYRQDRMELILLASEDCNFRCIYCSQQFKRGSMLPAVRTGVKNLVASRIRNIRSLNVSWFGGEPLLGYDAIEEIAPHCQALAKQYEINYTASITTNGYLLDPKRSRELLKWKVWSYQITVDGTALEHDAHRPLEDGGRTFDQIIDNIVAMKQYDEPFKMAIRFNFDNQNINRVKPLLELLRERLGDDPRYSMRFRPVGQWGGPNDDQLEVCSEKEISRHLLQLTDQARNAGLHSEDLCRGLEPGPDTVCYAARPYNLIIGADGKIMKCTVALDTEASNVVGQLSETGEVALDEDRFALWVKPYYRHDTMCSKCFFVPVCQGVICPLPRITSGERPCPTPKVEIQQTLKDIRKERERVSAPHLLRVPIAKTKELIETVS